MKRISTLGGLNDGLRIEQEFNQSSFGISNGTSLTEAFQLEHRAATVQPFDGELN